MIQEIHIVLKNKFAYKKFIRKCARCQEKFGFIKIYYDDRKDLLRYGPGNRLCSTCMNELNKEWMQKTQKLRKRKKNLQKHVTNRKKENIEKIKHKISNTQTIH